MDLGAFFSQCAVRSYSGICQIDYGLIAIVVGAVLFIAIFGFFQTGLGSDLAHTLRDPFRESHLGNRRDDKK